MHMDEHDLPCKLVMRDNDTQYPKTFDDLFTTPTGKVKRNLPASPNPQSHVERVTQTLKREGNAPSGIYPARHSPELVEYSLTSRRAQIGWHLPAFVALEVWSRRDIIF